MARKPRLNQVNTSKPCLKQNHIQKINKKYTKYIQNSQLGSKRRLPLCKEASHLQQGGEEASSLRRETTPLQQGDGFSNTYLKCKKRTTKATK